MKTLWTVALLCAVIVPCALSQADDNSTVVMDRVAPSLVQVEITLQYDAGRPPQTPGWAERCPGCGRYHIQRGPEYIEQERPMEAAGYLISPTKVVTGDVFLQPGFIKSIEVRYGEQVVSAQPVAHAIEQYAMLLELAEPLMDAEPLEFTAQPSPPFRAVHWQPSDARWSLQVQPVAENATILGISDPSERFVPLSARGLVIDSTNAPVGLTLNERLDLDGSWKGSPERWTWINRDDLTQLLSHTEQHAREVVPHVRLEFRRGTPSARSSRSYWDDSGGDDESVTERNALGVLADDRTVLVLASLDPRLTARLERILVFLDDEPVEAEFVGTLRDYGALVAQLPESATVTARFDREAIRSYGQRLLIAGEIELHGENRITRFSHTRIGGYEIGWRRNVYPQLAGDNDNVFLFHEDGRLIALPLLRRDRSGDQSHSYGRSSPVLTAAAQIAAVLDDSGDAFDSSNVPLSEQEQHRIAWLGVEMQPLDGELARMYNVSDITDDGSTGGLVSFVYAGSPAENAGIEAGDLLLRIHSPSRPRPINIEPDEDMFAMWGGFPWDYYDEMPEEYYDELPPPWPSADSKLNRTLTSLGFGEPVQVEVYRNDQQETLDLTVEQSPPHYSAGKRYRDETLGLTLRDMTYEVRRYFQKPDDEPGLIIARLETGSRASVTGLKPYEIITHINDIPLHSVDDYERIKDEHEDLRLKVERMHRTRVVRLNRPSTAQQDSQQDDDLAEVAESDSEDEPAE